MKYQHKYFEQQVINFNQVSFGWNLNNDQILKPDFSETTNTDAEVILN